MRVIPIVIDESTPRLIAGTYEFNRTAGGILIIPAGASFPATPTAGELFWRTDEARFYRRNDANDAWDAVQGILAAHASTHNAGGADALAIDAAAGTGSLRTLGTSATSACAGNDGRLSDARTPAAHSTSHKNGGTDEVAVATAAANAIPKANASAKLDIGWLPTGSTSSTVCIGNDARLSDSRAPTAHASTHNAGGADALAIDAAAGTGSLRTLGTAATAACAGNDSRLSNARTPTAHASTHNAGGADALAIDAAAGTGSLRTLGTAATAACAGNDSRLSDARAPTGTASGDLGGSYPSPTVVDLTITGEAQGDLLYFNGTNWIRLPAGTSGYYLKTNGAAANPAWAAVTGTGDVVGPSSATDNAIARYDATTGKLLQNSIPTIDDDGNISLVNHDLRSIKAAVHNSVIAHGSMGATETFDWSAGMRHSATNSATCTITFTAPPGPCNLMLLLTNGGAYALTWPATVKWAGGAQPTWTASGVDVVAFFYDGTNYYGVASLNFA